jgi:putative endonuclease
MPAKAGIQSFGVLDPGLRRGDDRGMAAYVYILASRRNGTLYVGVTTDLVRRVGEHKEDVVEGFIKKYGVKMLVHFDVFDDVGSAIVREKQLKEWKRAWKLRLIEESNPEWRDLYTDIVS